MERHEFWNTGWEVLAIRRMLKGLSPEMKIVLLGLYLDEVQTTTDLLYIERVSKELVAEDTNDMFLECLRESGS